jgi:hypothetical protein
MDHATIAERPLPFRSIGLFKDSIEVPELPCPHAKEDCHGVASYGPLLALH